jgi:hypothetical protein
MPESREDKLLVLLRVGGRKTSCKVLKKWTYCALSLIIRGEELNNMNFDIEIYDHEKSQERHKALRAEIEANRTPEERIEAEQIRAQRAAYEALSNSRKQEISELEVFNAFAAVAEARIDSGSGFNTIPREPDIRCGEGALHYFELGEVTDKSVAHSMAVALRDDEVTGSPFSQDQPFANIIEKKRGQTYTTNWAPVELLLYYQTQHPPLAWHFEKLLANSMADLEALVTTGPFQRVWIFDFAKRQVLWHSSTEATNTAS